MEQLAMDKTIIYITNNQLDERINRICQRNILEATKGFRLISISQKPIVDFGENICVGDKPRSSLSINEQMMEGLKRVKTEYVAIAEHDCLYTKEHFEFIPPDKKTFWYNENVWMLQTYSQLFPEMNGMFSFFKGRKANSQLVCGTEIMIQATQERIDIMSDPAWLRKYPSGRIGEAGTMAYRHAMRLANGHSVAHLREKLSDYVERYSGKNWRTNTPNVDIRHDKNLTKNQRGVYRRETLAPWGTIQDIWNLAS